MVLAVSPAAVEDDGGYRVTLTGTAGSLTTGVSYQAFVIMATGAFAPCHSGVVGQGRLSVAGTDSIEFVVPRMLTGGPFGLRIESVGGAPILTTAPLLYVRAHWWRSRIFQIRSALPPRILVGARRLESAPIES
jgi:hypothetical protein